MVDDAIIFLTNQLNRSLRSLSAPDSNEDTVALVSGEKLDPISFKSEAISVLLINVEEVKALPESDRFSRVDAVGARQKVQPEIRLNLLLLFVAQFKEYERSLSYLSGIIRYFQSDRVFNKQNAPELSEKIGKLVVELVTPPFAEQNQIWGILRTTYRPSLLYRVKTIVFKDESGLPETLIEEPETLIEEPETLIYGPVRTVSVKTLSVGSGSE